jgi:hypothetical protein
VWHNWKFRVTDGHCTQGEENVTSHHVRRAAAIESLHLNSPLPLLAARRFIEGPKQERFVAASVARSLAFLNGKSARDHD